MHNHGVRAAGPVGRPVHARAVSGAGSSNPARSHSRNQSRASNARMVARVFPGATTGRWLARPPCHRGSRVGRVGGGRRATRSHTSRVTTGSERGSQGTGVERAHARWDGCRRREARATRGHQFETGGAGAAVVTPQELCASRAPATHCLLTILQIATYGAEREL